MRTRYNQIGFTLVEITLSGIYIWSLLGLLNLKASVRQRRVMLDIIYVNVIIVSLDIIVVVLVYLNQTGISHPMQTFSYALKLKLEFVVLNQLMAVAARGVQRANFEERRYHHSSATDPFSAECREWDKKTSDLPKEEGKGPRQENHELSHSGSLQITLPSPTVSKHDRRQSNMAGHDEAASPRPKRDADNSLRDKSRNRTYDQERIEENVFEMDENLQPDSFLDVDDNDTDAIRHKPSEAFSGDTLRSPAPRTASPPSYTRRLKEAKDQVLRPTRSPSSRRGHDRLVTGNERKPPHKARFRKSIPKNARFVHEEDEEEEIGVHMWENNRGSLVLEVPWFRSKVEG